MTVQLPHGWTATLQPANVPAVAENAQKIIDVIEPAKERQRECPWCVDTIRFSIEPCNCAEKCALMTCPRGSTAGIGPGSDLLLWPLPVSHLIPVPQFVKSMVVAPD